MQKYRKWWNPQRCCYSSIDSFWQIVSYAYKTDNLFHLISTLYRTRPCRPRCLCSHRSHQYGLSRIVSHWHSLPFVVSFRVLTNVLFCQICVSCSYESRRASCDAANSRTQLEKILLTNEHHVFLFCVRVLRTHLWHVRLRRRRRVILFECRIRFSLIMCSHNDKREVCRRSNWQFDWFWWWWHVVTVRQQLTAHNRYTDDNKWVSTMIPYIVCVNANTVEPASMHMVGSQKRCAYTWSVYISKLHICGFDCIRYLRFAYAQPFVSLSFSLFVVSTSWTFGSILTYC